MELSYLQSEYYPIVIISDLLKFQFDKEIPISLEVPTEPQKPTKKKSDAFGCLIIPLPIIVVLVILNEMPIETIGIISLLILSFVSVLWLKETNDNRNKYREAIEKYNLQYSLFKKQKELFEIEKNRINNATNAKKIRNIQNLNILKNSDKPHKKLIGKKGISEVYFENYLNFWFKGNIFKNYSFNSIDDSYIPFQPDFILQYKDIHIDIEIDEPYTLQEGIKIPIHHYNNYDIDTDDSNFCQDENRDDYFTNGRGWIVIRFAEEQVVFYPNECCKVIANTLYELTGDSFFLDKLIEFGIPHNIKKWNISEAISMAKSDYRDRYLKKIKHYDININDWNDSISLENMTKWDKLRPSYEIEDLEDSEDELPF